MAPLLVSTDDGLYCPAGDFHIDPWRPVDRAILTHAHGDHAVRGCRRYLAAATGEPVFRARLGPEADITPANYGQPIDESGVRISLHPAGHILGSAQVRLEHRSEVWVVSGDYKLAPDATCEPFEPIRCHTFVTESTFGLPIYRWPAPEQVFADINAWWRANADAGRTSMLYGYALGKAQRLLTGLDPSIGPIYCHGAVEVINAAYRDAGVALPPTEHAVAARGRSWAGSMIVAPPLALGTPWMRKFGEQSSALASGWMTIRGLRRRKAVDRGFVLSDHADWPSLLTAIAATGAERVGVTHGYTAVMARWLHEQGKEAWIMPTRYQGEVDEVMPDAESNP
ncbi:MAG TPA: ligase-associated DNA damage response exonuclease [Gemmataceae bacterium]|jgi:putative mRNA 3-end processing factor|nr:ligase-associated DNA damage response exonuclease [Gemmataceae bacterium]